MARALTREESHPPVVPASAEVAAAVRAYKDACFMAAHHSVYNPGTDVDWEASGKVQAAWRTLEDLLLRLAAERGREWHRVGDLLWGVGKRSKFGLELVCEPVGSDGTRREAGPPR